MTFKSSRLEELKVGANEVMIRGSVVQSLILHNFEDLTTPEFEKFNTP